MSDYQIRFDPRLEINPADFVAAWNDSSDCKAITEAQVDSSTAVDFDSSAAKVLTLLGGIAIGVTTNTVYDLIKSTVINLPTVQKTSTQTLPVRSEFVDIQQIEQPDGTKLLIVILKER